MDVKGEVKDASPIAWVRIAGREAQLSGTTFTATGVPIGDGPEVSLTGEAEDAAGNLGRGVLPLIVDRQPPAVTIDRPEADAYVRGPVLEVEGTVTDQGDVTVEVNGVPEDVPASLRAPRSYRARVPVTDAATSAIVATAIDAAGNRGSAPGGRARGLGAAPSSRSRPRRTASSRRRRASSSGARSRTFRRSTR